MSVKLDEIVRKVESSSQRYKELQGKLEAMSQRSKAVFAVIEESWRRLGARRDAFVGPEPVRPSRWRVFAYMKWRFAHLAWSARCRVAAYDFLSPTRADIMDAAESLGASDLIPYLMDVYAGAHRERSGEGA